MSDPRTLKNAFNSTAKWRSDNLAFVQARRSDQRLTYEEANDRARRLATGLESLGIEKSDRVAILSETSVNHALTFYACQKIGAVPSTLHARETADKLQWMVNHIDAKALLFQSAFTDTVGEIEPNLSETEHFISYEDDSSLPDDAVTLSDVLAHGSAEEPSTEVRSSDPALINFTSGSTGKPKGVVHTHENCVEAAHLGGQVMYGTQPSDVYLNAFTPSFIAWVNATLPVINAGGTMVYLEEWEPAEIPALIEEEELSILWFIPTHWKQILEADIESHDLSSLRRIGYAGEPMSNAVYQELQEQFGTDIVTAYGSTEILTSGTVLHPEEVNPDSLDSVGKPMPNVDVRIVEPDTGDPEKRVETGEIGEILIRAPTLATGLWEAPEREEGLFHEDGWWISGDLGYVGEDGNVRIEGRVDNMIISGGINIYAENVERILEQHPDVRQCAIIPAPHEEWGQTLKAYLITDQGVTEDSLDEWCRDHSQLSNYQRPRAFAFVDQLPITATGKVDRAALERRE